MKKVAFEGPVKMRTVRIEFAGNKAEIKRFKAVLDQLRSVATGIMFDLGRLSRKGVPLAAVASAYRSVLDADVRMVFIPEQGIKDMLSRNGLCLMSRFSHLSGRSMVSTHPDDKRKPSAENNTYGVFSMQQGDGWLVLEGRLPSSFNFTALREMVEADDRHVLVVIDGLRLPTPKVA